MFQVVPTVVALAVASVLCAAPARGDDAVKQLVKDEIKAYMDKKKEDDTKDKVFKAKWKDGLVFETPDKATTMKIGGRMHLDTVLTDADAAIEGPNPGLNDEFQDQTYFRRLRLAVSGDITKHVDYKIQLEFSTPNSPQVKDAWITLKNMKDCLGCWMPSIRVGHMFESIGLEHQTSSNHTSMIEKSLTNALSPERSIGVMLLDSFWNEHAVGQVGFFSTDTTDDGEGFAIWDDEEGDAGWAVTGRFGLIPWAKDTCRFLHVGVGASYRSTDEVRYRARPGIAKGPFVADTIALTDVDNVWLWSAEAAFVWSSFHVASELMLADVSWPGGREAVFSAFYVQASWFVTGEAKAWSFQTAQWGNTKPCCSFLSNSCCCWGGLELVARFDTLDLNDDTVAGGELTNVAAGFNWYLNPNMRLMFNVVHGNIQDRASGGVVLQDEDVTSFLMRWDVHF